MVRVFQLKNFDKGLVTQLEPHSIPEQAASDSLNWLTLGDKIELSGGYTIVGTENAGAGKITGLHVATKVDGSLLPIRTRGKKIEYYTTDWVESGTDQLGTAADGEDIAITSYTSLAGYQAWISSPNSGYFKMMLANPGSIKDLYSASKNFKGYIIAADNSIYLWYRQNNKNYLYRSYKDLQNTTVYTTVASETTVGTCSISIASPAVITKTAHGLSAGNRVQFSTDGALPTGLSVGTIYFVITAGLGADTFRVSLTSEGAAINTSGTQSGTHTLYKSGEFVGNSGSTTYTGTLSAITPSRTCFNVVFTDGVTTLTDDKNGAFTGSSGGTGTINYATGVYSITFTSPAVRGVSVGYSHEDSTVQGVADFTFSATRIASQGFFLPQPTGGDLLTVLGYQTDFYCIHEKNAWLLTIESDDVTASNKEWRNHIGMANWRGAVSTADGIYYIDVKDPVRPEFKLLTLQYSANGIGTEVIPIDISSSLDLTGFDFSDSVGFQWGDYILFQGKQNGSTVNDRLFAYNLIWKSFDVLDYNASCLANYDDELWAGDVLSNNVMKLFASTSANGAIINNYWIGKLTKFQIEELKKTKRLTIKGAIGADQEIKISLAFDRGNFVEVGRILGTGSYIDRTREAVLGSSAVGSESVGGGSDGTPKFNYTREFHSELLNVMTRFDEVQIKIEALNVGYASVTEINFYDIKTYGQKNLRRFRST